MNDAEKHMILPDQVPAVGAVKSELEHILKQLRQGNVPDKETVSGLQQLFQEYLDTCRKAKTIPEDTHPLEGSKKTGKVIWRNVLPDGQAVCMPEEDFFGNTNNIKLLKRLVLKKLIPETEIAGDTSLVDYLAEAGYVAAVSMDSEALSQRYYLLTTKGWHCLSDERVREILTEKDPSFVFPKKVLSNPENWTEPTFFKLARMQKYFEGLGITDYMIFADQKEPQMQFGCEIRDSYSVSYCFAADFDGNLEVKESARLYELGRSDKVDELVVIVHSKEEENRLKLQRGLDASILKKLRFYILV